MTYDSVMVPARYFPGRKLRYLQHGIGFPCSDIEVAITNIKCRILLVHGNEMGEKYKRYDVVKNHNSCCYDVKSL